MIRRPTDPSAVPREPPAKKPVPKVKRVQSTDLLAGPVLKRDVNTARLKDLHTIGKKLGQCQFGTTCLCVEKAIGKELACKSIAKRKLLTQEIHSSKQILQVMEKFWILQLDLVKNSICGDLVGYYKLEDLEHDLDDVCFLEQYRKMRLAKLREAANLRDSVPLRLSLAPISFVRCRRLLSYVWVVVLLYKDG
ncbi:hypothetical protein GUJ93_ZPchr0002g23061 [Zizania palustris]|uniref:Protein kinase domain-containing protein n=1 Tax=Zizania palustris TaxID=103762 RepID=A0A8J5SJF7_ZIZPA|nr:hypothetical protein GUJ93_ZPchr0002g23061 [Zizania palustris]